MTGRSIEPAEAILAALVGVGLGSSVVLIWHGRQPLSAVAARHPVAFAYLVAHLAGLLPERVDPMAWVSRAVRRTTARATHTLADAIDP